MSSIGAGFAAPCFQLLRFLTKPPVAAPLLIVATVVILINGYRFAKFSLWCIFTCGVCSFCLTKLVNGGQVDPGQPVDPLTRVDMFDPSLVKIDTFPVILMGWTG